MKYILIILFTCIYFFETKSQQVILPMDIPPYLSGNFGELRTNHFHSGIDFKTQGTTGIPVQSIKDGYISRIFISPSGYGRALYVDHPDGTTTVYAHLDHFSKKLETFARDSQYIKQSFFLDISVSPQLFPVKQGEIIGYSGNTGSSGGPHLHFELRETSTQEAHDPLVLYTDKINDSRKPVFQSFMIYPKAGKGVINGKTEKVPLHIKKDKKGNEILSPEKTTVYGQVGFAVKAYDYMNDTHNSFGVKEIILKIDKKEIFRSDMAHFAFSETRYLNSYVDWEEWTYNKSFYMKSFIDPGNKLNIYRMTGDGFFDFNEERDYHIQYILKDLYGNIAVRDFTVTGKKQAIPEYHPDGIPFPYNQDNTFEKNGIFLSIPVGNLYKDVYLKYDTVAYYTPFAPLYKLHKRTPLHSYCQLSIKIIKDIYPEKEKYGIICVNDGKKSWVGGNYENGKITTKIRELGSFSIDIDTIIPTVTELNPQSWAKNKCISFKISDSGSGINYWTAELNGKFVLFEFDAKKAHLFCNYDPSRMKAGKQKLRLTVRDACNNEKIIEKIFNW